MKIHHLYVYFTEGENIHAEHVGSFSGPLLHLAQQAKLEVEAELATHLTQEQQEVNGVSVEVLTVSEGLFTDIAYETAQKIKIHLDLY